MVFGMFAGIDDVHAIDMPITGLKLIVVDKMATANNAKAVPAPEHAA